MRFILALILALPLASCKTDDDGPLFPNPWAAPSKSELAAKDDADCRSYGAKPGTDIYIQCRMSRAAARDAADAAPLPTVNNVPVPPSDAPPIRNNIPRTVRCQTMGAQTICQ